MKFKNIHFFSEFRFFVKNFFVITNHNIILIILPIHCLVQSILM